MKPKKQAVIDLVARRGAAKDIADELGIERETLYNWKRKLLSEEVPCKLPKERDDRSIGELEEYAESLRRGIDRLELQRAILEGTVEFLEKDRSVEPEMPANRENTILAESLRSAHRLGALLDAVGMAKSSYLYQKNALLRPDKHADLRIRITEVFHGSDGRYGYRRVHSDPRRLPCRRRTFAESWKKRGSSPSTPASASTALAKARSAMHPRT